MSLLKTKPRYCAFVEATENGWINSKTGELLVSIRGLKSKLAADALIEVEETSKPVIEETKIEETSEVMIEETSEVMIEETSKPAIEETKVEVVTEQTAKKPKKNQKIIAEVVEYKLDGQDVIGE